MSEERTLADLLKDRDVQEYIQLIAPAVGPLSRMTAELAGETLDKWLGDDPAAAYEALRQTATDAEWREISRALASEATAALRQQRKDRADLTAILRAVMLHGLADLARVIGSLTI